MASDADVPERVTSLKGRIETVEERRERFDQVTLEKSTLASAREQAWGKYKPLINDTERNTFHTNFQTASQTYDAEYIKPVAEAHARWLKSSMFKAVLEHHFDPEDINAGLALAALVYICVSGTSALAPCQKLYEQWLKEGPTSDNPLWRAFRLNSDTLADELQQAATVIPTTGWEALWQAYTDTLAQLKMPGDITEWRQTTADVLNPMMVELSTPTAKVVAEYPNAAPGKALQAMLGMHAGKPVQVVEVVGTRRQLYSAMVKQLLRMSQGKAMNLGDFQAAVDEQMAIWRAQGVPLDDEIRHWALMFDDTAMAEAAQANLSPGERAQKVVAGTAAPAELDKKAGRVITVDPDSFMGQTIELARTPTLVASGALVLSIVSLENFMAKERDALKGASDRAWWMVKSAWAGVIGGTFDLAGAVVTSNVTARIPLARTLAARLSGRLTLLFVEGFGLAGGFVAIGIAAVVDGWNAYEAYIQGEGGLALLYVVNLAAKGTVAGMFAWGLLRIVLWQLSFELGPLGWTLIALTFALDWIISWVNDPATMDWTGNCLWGTRDDSTYDNGREEHADFLKAVGLA